MGASIGRATAGAIPQTSQFRRPMRGTGGAGPRRGQPALKMERGGHLGVLPLPRAQRGQACRGEACCVGWRCSLFTLHPGGRAPEGIGYRGLPQQSALRGRSPEQSAVGGWGGSAPAHVKRVATAKKRAVSRPAPARSAAVCVGWAAFSSTFLMSRSTREACAQTRGEHRDLVPASESL